MVPEEMSCLFLLRYLKPTVSGDPLTLNHVSKSVGIVRVKLYLVANIEDVCLNLVFNLKAKESYLRSTSHPNQDKMRVQCVTLKIASLPSYLISTYIQIHEARKSRCKMYGNARKKLTAVQFTVGQTVWQKKGIYSYANTKTMT
jgi:hypothetical protein